MTYDISLNKNVNLIFQSSFEKNNENIDSITSLSEEILLYLTQKLSRDSWLAFSLTCRSFRRIAFDKSNEFSEAFRIKNLGLEIFQNGTISEIDTPLEEKKDPPFIFALNNSEKLIVTSDGSISIYGSHKNDIYLRKTFQVLKIKTENQIFVKNVFVVNRYIIIEYFEHLAASAFNIACLSTYDTDGIQYNKFYSKKLFRNNIIINFNHYQTDNGIVITEINKISKTYKSIKAFVFKNDGSHFFWEQKMKNSLHRKIETIFASDKWLVLDCPTPRGLSRVAVLNVNNGSKVFVNKTQNMLISSVNLAGNILSMRAHNSNLHFWHIPTRKELHHLSFQCLQKKLGEDEIEVKCIHMDKDTFSLGVNCYKFLTPLRRKTISLDLNKIENPNIEDTQNSSRPHKRSLYTKI